MEKLGSRTLCSVYENSEEGNVTGTAWWRESDEIGWQKWWRPGPLGLLAIGRILTWTTGGFLSEKSPGFFPRPRWHMIVEELLVYLKINPSPPLLQLSMPFLESPTLKGNASSCSQWTFLSTDDTLRRDRARTLLVWVRSHWVLQRQRGMI